MTERPLVSICIVTFDSARHIGACLEAVTRQSYVDKEVFVIDNASRDETVVLVERSPAAPTLICNRGNTGFAAAHNQGIQASRGEFYLALNPDVVMSPSFLEEMVEVMRSDERIGSASGKLLRPSSAIDSTGIYMTPSVRHLDRGAAQEDLGQYERREYVFGASGAAALYRRAMLEDVAVDGQYFDEDFFAYREDADLAWRAQLFGWRAIYTPRAVATHERRVVPERRKRLPPELNMHSVKNRFLMRLKNQSVREWLALPFAFVRDLEVVVYVLLVERTSLPGLAFVARHLGRIWSERRKIAARRKVGAKRMLLWFRREPAAFEAPFP